MNSCFELCGVKPNLSGYRKVVAMVLKVSGKGSRSVNGYYRLKDDLLDYIVFVDSKPNERWLEVMHDYAEDYGLCVANRTVTSAVLVNILMYWMDIQLNGDVVPISQK